MTEVLISSRVSLSVIAASFREIEDRIDKQTWRLAQELFREHMQPAMYEVIVEKYKGQCAKRAMYEVIVEKYKGQCAKMCLVTRS